uniref:thiol oxidase n=1 Tax=viral metagenome TaxID=1070528 RepID=A0A6C0BB34_9ZZZZ
MHNKTKKVRSFSKTYTFQEKTYNKEDYLSGDGMLTTVWGPGIWLFLHTMSFNYPVEPTEADKQHYRDFVLNLQYVLPCKYCRMNLEKNFKQLPLTMADMRSRESFSRYIYELHELINRMLNKKSNLTYDDVRERYEHFRARCTKDTKEKKIIANKTRRKKSKSKSKSNLKLNSKMKKEKGCTEPLYGKKSKCILKIVPQDKNVDTFQMDKKCIKVK